MNSLPLNSKKVIVGMSGGVDSSVAAYLLKQQGYRVEGVFMKNWEEDDGSPYCTAIKDLSDAQQACQTLGIPLHTANFSVDYWDNVFTHFLQEYQEGRTPNPDVLCNREIKFKVFVEYAESLGADLVATGHYAKIVATKKSYQLHKGMDRTKDQSYFLYAVNSSVWKKCLFPLGDLSKPEVREIAARKKLANHDKKDSTGICFIGERRFKNFLKTYIASRPGDIETLDGKVVGHHDGLMYYTYGQRKGLGIGGVKCCKEEAWYLVEKDIQRNVLIVAQGENHPALLHNQVGLNNIHWINGTMQTIPFKCTAKIRYRQVDQPCHLSREADGYLVTFERAQRAVAPGQSLVLYKDQQCLGGGVITSKF